MAKRFNSLRFGFK